MIDREQALAALAAEEFDVVVVGGGITGAGVALDAATRGYSRGAGGAQRLRRRNLQPLPKLVHGGLRYLQHLDLGLVREALLERQLLVALAPHLVRPLALVVPAFDGVRPDRLMGVGLNLYDVMARDRLRTRKDDAEAAWSPARHRTISGEEVLELLPALAAREPTSGYLFYDCQTDDARLVLTVLGEAERFGAVCANRLGALSLLEEEGRARGVRVRDGESGAEFEVRAANVVNATGVWADELRPEELQGEAELRIRPTRGTHITLRHEDLPLGAGAIVPAGGGRTIFALPWLGAHACGDHRQRLRGPLAGARGARRARKSSTCWRPSTSSSPPRLTPEHLTGAYAGVRPLISTGEPRSRWTSRARPSCMRLPAA